MKNTPVEIEKGMIKKNIELQTAIEEVPTLIDRKAQAERDYDVAVAKKTLEFKTSGNPITLITKMVAGDKVIADLKLQCNLSTELLKLQYKKLKAIEISIGSYQSMHALRRIEYQKANIVA